MKAKLALIHYSYPPIIGGVEIVVREQAHFFSENGFEVTVLAGEGKADRPSIQLIQIPELVSLKKSNPSLYEESMTKEVFSDSFLSLSQTILGRLEKELADQDIIIVHNMLTFTYNLAFNHAFHAYATNHPEKTIIGWTHDVSLTVEREKRDFANPEVTTLVYRAYPHVNYIGISSFLKQTLIEKIQFDGEVKVVPNTINIGDFLELHSETMRIAQEYGLLDADILVLSPTKIMEHKNVLFSLEILSQMRTLFTKPRLIITAKGMHHNKSNDYVKQVYAAVERLNLSEQVLFLDDIISPEYKEDDYRIVKDLYRLSDIVFFLSSYENFGLPLLEAGITKTPILCNTLEVFKEIESEHISFTTLDEDPARIATQVAVIVTQENQPAFFRKIKEKYSMQTVYTREVLPFINQLMKKGTTV